MSEQIDLQSVKFDAKSAKTADQRELAALNIGASKLQQEFNKDTPALYLAGKTIDGKPFSFNAKIVKDGVEINGFEFEGKKYKGSEPFVVKFEHEKLNEKDKGILQDALGSQSVTIPQAGLIAGLLSYAKINLKKTITFKEAGHVASLDISESKGDMKLALEAVKNSDIALAQVAKLSEALQGATGNIPNKPSSGIVKG